MSIFIVFDGLDGSGKGEMISRLKDYLSDKKDFKVLLTKEPTDGKYGAEIRKMLKQEKDPLARSELCLELFVKDRKEHLEKEIEPFLKQKNSIVISDRYYYSTIAFQQAQGIELEKVIFRNIPFRNPDIAFILDLPAETAIKRIDKRGLQKEKFEQLMFMKQLRKNFLNLKKDIDDNIKIIDASKPRKEVFAQIRSEIDKLL